MGVGEIKEIRFKLRCVKVNNPLKHEIGLFILFVTTFLVDFDEYVCCLCVIFGRFVLQDL